MSRRELAGIWLAASAYTAYVVLVAAVIDPHGLVLGLAFLAASVGPLIAWSFWAIR
jgi:hypothetical protein